AFLSLLRPSASPIDVVEALCEPGVWLFHETDSVVVLLAVFCEGTLVPLDSCLLYNIRSTWPPCLLEIGDEIKGNFPSVSDRDRVESRRIGLRVTGERNGPKPGW